MFDWWIFIFDLLKKVQVDINFVLDQVFSFVFLVDVVCF